MLQQILRDLYVDPEILAELDEQQKQTLFCKMREEQVRRWKEWDAKANITPKDSSGSPRNSNGSYKSSKGSPRNSIGSSSPNGTPTDSNGALTNPNSPNGTSKNNKTKKTVGFLKGIDGEPWVWVMGEHENDRTIEDILNEEAREKARKQAEKEAEELRKQMEEKLSEYIDLTPKIEDLQVSSPKLKIEDDMDIYCSVDELREKMNNKAGMRNGVMNGINHGGSIYTGHNFSGNNFSGDEHIGNDYSGDDYGGNDYRGDDFRGDGFRGDDFRGNDFRGNDFRGNDYRGNDFSGNNYSDNNYSDNNYSGNNYSGNNYSGNNLSANNYTINHYQNKNKFKIMDNRDVLQEISLNKQKVAQRVALWEKRLTEEKTSEILQIMQTKKLEAAKEAEEAEKKEEQLWIEQERKAKLAEQQIREIARKAREEHRLTSNLQLETTPYTSVTPGVPPGKNAVLDWYRSKEVPRMAGLDPSNNLEPWFHGLITRGEAETLLQDTPEGSFLVRLSERIWGYAISYKSRDKCKHYLVNAIQNYSFLGNNQTEHKSLCDLITHHHNFPLSGGERLLQACPRNASNNAINELFQK